MSGAQEDLQAYVSMAASFLLTIYVFKEQMNSLEGKHVFQTCRLHVGEQNAPDVSTSVYAPLARAVLEFLPDFHLGRRDGQFIITEDDERTNVNCDEVIYEV